MSELGLVADLQKQMMSFQKGGPWLQARNFAIFSGVNAGLNTAMRRYRKRDDVRNTCAAACVSVSNTTGCMLPTINALMQQHQGLCADQLV